MTTEVLTCPFCNGKARVGPNDAMSYTVRCANCGSRGPVLPLPDDNPRRFTMAEIEEGLKTRAIRGWNRRGFRMGIVDGDIMLDLRSGQEFKVTGCDFREMACREVTDNRAMGEFREISPDDNHYRHFPNYDTCRMMVQRRFSAWRGRCHRYPQTYGEDYCWQHA